MGMLRHRAECLLLHNQSVVEWGQTPEILIPCLGLEQAWRSWLITLQTNFLKVYWEMLALASFDTSNSKESQKQQ